EAAARQAAGRARRRVDGDRAPLRGPANRGPPPRRRDPGLRRGRAAPLMVIDTSAFLAILLQEAEARAFAEAIEQDPVRLVSAGTFLETSMVLQARHGA